MVGSPRTNGHLIREFLDKFTGRMFLKGLLDFMRVASRWSPKTFTKVIST